MLPHLLAALSSNAPIFIEKISNIHWPEGKKKQGKCPKDKTLEWSKDTRAVLCLFHSLSRSLQWRGQRKWSGADLVWLQTLRKQSLGERINAYAQLCPGENEREDLEADREERGTWNWWFSVVFRSLDIMDWRLIPLWLFQAVCFRSQRFLFNEKVCISRL